MAAVLTRNIIKKFGEVPAISGITLSVPDGEFVVLLGPSGCGKTTFLRIICGLERQTSGDLIIDGNLVNDIPPRARGVAMMFQSYGLYPHYTVRKNIAFPLRTQRVPGPHRTGPLWLGERRGPRRIAATGRAGGQAGIASLRPYRRRTKWHVDIL
jgi:ABC-type sugar transport system ATPase subunit